MSCDHTERRTVLVTKEDCWGEEYQEWETQEKCLQVDIDLHRFKCTRCGEIGYYSGAARRFYEGGASEDDLYKLGKK